MNGRRDIDGDNEIEQQRELPLAARTAELVAVTLAAVIRAEAILKRRSALAADGRRPALIALVNTSKVAATREQLTELELKSIPPSANPK